MGINVGKVDRGIRLIIAAVLVVLGVFGVLKGTFALVGYVVAAIAVLTGMLRVCPLWSVFKINTAK
ncbi:DUF2892 domain-containing protein [candidate division KSB1 bacterium]|nr:DUF2892 domain-containing protein [candidate division KSB1 bacterium]